MLKKILFSVIIVITLLTSTSPSIYAAKIQKVITSTRKTTYAVNVGFTNVKNAKKITYVLTYQRAGGINDGASGTLNPNGKNISKILTLGTCSHNVCTYHKGVKNIKLKVTVWYSPSLTSETKTYNIK